MKYQKITAVFLICIMILGLLPEGIFANPQKPIKEIQKVTVSHGADTASGKIDSIVPNVQVDWIPPDENDNVDSSTDTTKNPTLYDFNITNMNDSSNTATKKSIKVEELSVTNNIFSVKLEKYFSSTLKNGALYKTKIIARHTHQIQLSDGSFAIVDAPSSGGIIPEAYFITDFDITAHVEGGLAFSWEYIPGVHYRLHYEKGIYNSSSDMPATGITITPETAKNNLSEDGSRVVWNVDSAVAGQIYSAYVVPVGIDNKNVSFDEIIYNSSHPKVVRATPNIKLYIDKLGQNKIRLSWNIKDAAWVQVDNKLYQTVIWEINEKGEEKELGRIYNENNGNKDVGYFECSMPDGIASYRVDFILKETDGSIRKGFSAGPATCVPEDLREVPFQPRIPELFSYKEGDTLLKEDIDNQDKYKVKFNEIYDDLILKNNNIKEFMQNTFHYEIENNKANLQIIWDVPKDTETGEKDYSLYYDLWVSETADTFTDENKVLNNFKFDEKKGENLIYKQDGKTVIGLKTVVKGLATNKTYYIKVVSKRKYNDGEYTVSLPTVKEVSIDKVGDMYEPPVVGKPPLQITDTTKNSISIQWAEEWYEIMAKAEQAAKYENADNVNSEVEKLLAKWGHSRVYLDTSKTPVLRYLDESKSLTPIDLYGSSVEQKLSEIAQALEKEGTRSQYVQKYIQMGKDTKYKVKVVKQSEVDAARGTTSLEEWVKNIDESEIRDSWLDITSSLSNTKVDGVDGKAVTFSKDHYGVNLTANTPYIILISAYRNIDGEDEYSAFPSYILGTTLTDHTAQPEIPKTPRLYNYKNQDVRDMEVTVRWIFNENFDYKLVYSRGDNPEEAVVWNFTEEDKKTFVHGAEAYVTIAGLLPETTYNFWIMAIQKPENLAAGEVPQSSDWSTPVTSTTKSISAPVPPSGLGLASAQSILEAGQDFSPKGGDYLTIEWMKNPSDTDSIDSRISYSYVVEFADNVEFLDSVVVITGGADNNSNNENNTEDNIGHEIIAKNLVKFTNLRSNMPYYVKVKTVLTFTDGDKVIIKESSFTNWVRILTSTSNNEYDGGENDNIVIYPEPVEESYKNDIWTYEIVDAAKITTQIQNNKQYFYTITLENYKDRYDAAVRRIKMPKKVLDTLINKGMALKVVTNIAIYEIPGKTLKYYSEQYNAADTVQFDFTKMSYLDIASYARSYPEQYVSGEKIEISLKGTSKSTAVTKLDDYMKVKLKLDVAGLYNYTNVATYQYNYATGSWNKFNYEVDVSDNHYLAYSSIYTGLNALYQRSASVNSSSSTYAMNELINAYNIKGLGTSYGKYANVGSSQYVSLLLGMRLNRNEINLMTSATADDYAKAKAAGLYVSSSRGYVTKEQALSGIVKLYEVKSGYQIKPSQITFNNVSSNYRLAASKAYAVGLVDSLSNPQAPVTYSELCDWLIQVM